MHAARPTFLILVLAATLSSLGCENTQRGLEQDAQRNGKKAEEGAKKLGDQAQQGAEKAAEAASDAAANAGQQVDAAATTLAVKTALMADKRVDSSRIDVDSEAAVKIVHLRGKVGTQAEVDVSRAIAEDKAPGWRISNELIVEPVVK